MNRYVPLLPLALLALSTTAQPALQKAIQTKLIMAEDNSIVQLDAGRVAVTNTLSLEGKKRITIRGAGMDKTILSFAGQTDGAEGLRISNAEEIVLENLTVEDAKGDAVKAMNVRGITFRNVKTAWTGKPSAKNGAYGLYPVQCDGVLIDGCAATGASDAGIYVGQSKNIVVRNSKAWANVAGIEIENSLDADVYGNEAWDNTGGLLVFDLPDLVQKRGGRVRVHDNHLHDNNRRNFAPKGNIVAKVPDGTGIMILATSDVEIFRNRIQRNKSIGTSIISYFMTENPITDKQYYPYPTAISIHDNVYERDRVRPTGRGRLGKLFRFKLRFGKDVPHIMWDGITDPALRSTAGSLPADKRICIRNNQNQSVVNLDAENNFKNISRDVAPFDCTLPPVQVAKANNP